MRMFLWHKLTYDVVLVLLLQLRNRFGVLMDLPVDAQQKNTPRLTTDIWLISINPVS